MGFDTIEINLVNLFYCMLTIPISVILLDYALINITVGVVFTYTLTRLIFYDSCFNKTGHRGTRRHISLTYPMKNFLLSNV